MNIYKYLVIIKKEDKTTEVTSYSREGSHVIVNYKNSEKPYTYIKEDFEFYKDPTEINALEYKFITSQGYLYNVVKAIKFDKYYKLFFEDNTAAVISKNNIQLLKDNDIKMISHNKFEYFKDISKIVSVKTEDGQSLLTKEYEKINLIKKDMALYKYLNPRGSLSIVKSNNMIFPFGANQSQFQAVEKAMSNQISIIEGPPRNR